VDLSNLVALRLVADSVQYPSAWGEVECFGDVVVRCFPPGLYNSIGTWALAGLGGPDLRWLVGVVSHPESGGVADDGTDAAKWCDESFVGQSGDGVSDCVSGYGELFHKGRYRRQLRAWGISAVLNALPKSSGDRFVLGCGHSGPRCWKLGKV